MAITIQIKLNLQNDKEAKKLLGDLEKDYTVDAKVDTSQVKKGVNSIKSSLKEVGSSITNTFAMFGLAMGGVRQAVGMVKNTLGPLIAASNEQEAAVTSLNAALRNTGLNVESLSPKLQQYAAAIQKVTKYGDEAIISGTAMLQNIGDLSEDQLPAAQKAVVGLAARFNMDLKTAFELTGRAAKGQTQTLTRYGIVLDMTGTKEDQFNQLLEQGAEGFQIAKEQASDGAGALQQYKNIVGDLQESLGDLLKIALVPVVKTLGRAFTAATNFFKSLTQTPLQRTITELEELGVAAKEIIDLKRLMWQQQLEDINGELKKAGIKYDGIKDVTEEIKNNKQSLITLTKREAEFNDISSLSYTKIKNMYLEMGYAQEDAAKKAENWAKMENMKGRAAATVLNDIKETKQQLQAQNDKLLEYSNNLIQRETLEAKINKTLEDRPDKTQGEGGELTYSDKEVAAAQKQIETWLQQRQAALRSEGEAVAAEYNKRLKAAEIAYGKDSEEYKQAKVQLWAWRQEELEKIEQERLDTIDESKQKQLQAEQKGYEQQIKLLQAKKELGIDVTEELQRVQAEYVAWAKQAYGEDSQEYIDAMRDKKETTEQFWQSQHEFASGIFDSIASTWRTAWDTIIDTSMTGSQRVMAIWDSFKQSVWAVIGDITQKYIKDQLTQLAITESTEAAKTATHKAGILERIALDIWAGIKYVAVKLYEIAASITKFFSFLGPLAPVATGGVMAGIVAYLNSFKEGFKMGGFTGSGDPAEEAGVVHKGEYVFEAPLVSKYGSFLANLRGALQKGIAPAELFIPNVQFPQLATQPSPQIGYASGGEAVSNSKILQRLKAIEDAIVNKKMDGVLDLRDNRGGVDRYKAHLKAKDEYERKFR
jgi:hypothetical protein